VQNQPLVEILLSPDVIGRHFMMMIAEIVE
jgi:hypothetical protein